MCPLPFKGRSFRDWKFLGLRPRTIIAPDCTSHIDILPPVASVASTFSRTTKCCCSSFRRPLFAVAIRNCSLFHWNGKLAKSESSSCTFIKSSGIDGGSLSTLSSTAVAFGLAGVFQGTDIIFTGLPSVDSVALITSSWPNIGICSPCSVKIYLSVRDKVISPVIWNRLRR